ncbi:type II secretion system F family protein [Spongiactinospora sp. TRM90649]|uniref:type II secretion system F family protein n=1 Tax=Spongiactinospora sp. TRM90649 TaxID=3031114 RepID=UPI0023FA3BBC|nr:type II secretion system F family protein [Spongiactinospora sp. TRM90649]MDF5758425.1 type II secretion system F family protein [Spongiactinospora sp. TRM90649]
MTGLLAALAGALLVTGPLLAIAASRPVRIRPPHPKRRRLPPIPAKAALCVLGIFAVTWWATGWPVAAAGAAAGAVTLPRMLTNRNTVRRIRRLEALEVWTRHLADVLGGSAGLEEALRSSADNPPAPIAAEVRALARRLAYRMPTGQALRAFADDLDDPTGDMIAAALILACQARGKGLREVLHGLARTVAKDVAARRDIDAERATHRTTARWVVGALLGYTGFALLNRTYVAPLGTVGGQAVLAAVIALYAGAFTWLHRLAQPPKAHRFLNQTAERRS